MSDNSQTQDVSNANQGELDFDDLDNFSSKFFGRNDEQPVETNTDDEAEEEDTETGEPVDDTQDESEESEDTTDETDDEDEQKPEPQKRNRAQERITELNSKFREEQRRVADLEARIAELQRSSNKTEAPTQKTTTEGPLPTDTNEDGTDKYPLGEFDPNFIRDLTKHSIAEATKAAEQTAQQKAEQARQDQEQQRLNAEWATRQAPAQERYSDYGEKVASLEDVFSEVEPSYGEYLARTVMSMDKGPEVLYHLANNPDEARALIGMGATQATIRLARLETRFLDDGEPKPTPKPKVSKAPTPPPTNRGSAGGTKVVADDTDDLDAFSKKFFKRK